MRLAHIEFHLLSVRRIRSYSDVSGEQPGQIGKGFLPNSAGAFGSIPNKTSRGNRYELPLRDHGRPLYHAARMRYIVIREAQFFADFQVRKRAIIGQKAISVQSPPRRGGTRRSGEHGSRHVPERHRWAGVWISRGGSPQLQALAGVVKSL